jgi:hypothetical protein
VLAAMDDTDIWRAAQLLIRQRDDPKVFAAERSTTQDGDSNLD